MYLAVRLAVCELALPEGEPCPLIIDDALVNLDEPRLAPGHGAAAQDREKASGDTLYLPKTVKKTACGKVKRTFPARSVCKKVHAGLFLTAVYSV